MFVHLRDEARADARTDARVDALGRAGHPTFTLSVDGSEDLGRMFFLAEFATAVAGWVLEINPFDQPNVQEAKDATKRVLAAGSLPELPLADDDAVRALLAGARPGGYIALMGYVAPSIEFDEAVAELRATLMRADARGDDVRLRPALPALDRPAPQGRAAGRALPLADRRRGARRRDPRRRPHRSAR